MTTDQRERLRIVIQQAILVRQGSIITPEVADERSRNLVTIVEAVIREFEEEEPCKDGSDQETRGGPQGSGSSGPASIASGSTATRGAMGIGTGAGIAARNTGKRNPGDIEDEAALGDMGGGLTGGSPWERGIT